MDLNSIINNLSPKDINTVLTLIGSGTGVAIILQLLKHYGKFAEAKKIVTFMLGALSFLATYADYVLQYNNQNPKVVIGAHLGWVVAIAVFAHRFAVSPAYYKLVSFLNNIKANRAAYKQEKAALNDIPTVAPVAPQEFDIPS